MVDWELGRGDAGGLVALVRSRSEDLPVFLLTERTALPSVPLAVIWEVNEFVWKLEDTPDLIAGRVGYALRRYVRGWLPPFFDALVEFARRYEYSWHTP
jgi:arginine decarboxylase